MFGGGGAYIRGGLIFGGAYIRDFTVFVIEFIPYVTLLK